MSHLDKQKLEAVEKLKVLCERCRRGEAHACPVAVLVRQIKRLRGVPIIVNDRLHHVMFL